MRYSTSAALSIYQYIYVYIYIYIWSHSVQATGDKIWNDTMYSQLLCGWYSRLNKKQSSVGKKGAHYGKEKQSLWHKEPLTSRGMPTGFYLILFQYDNQNVFMRTNNFMKSKGNLRQLRLWTISAVWISKIKVNHNYSYNVIHPSHTLYRHYYHTNNFAWIRFIESWVSLTTSGKNELMYLTLVLTYGPFHPVPLGEIPLQYGRYFTYIKNRNWKNYYMAEEEKHTSSILRTMIWLGGHQVQFSLDVPKVIKNQYKATHRFASWKFYDTLWGSYILWKWPFDSLASWFFLSDFHYTHIRINA